MAQDRAEHLNPALMRFDNDLSDLRKTDKSNLAGKAYDNFGMDDDGEATSGGGNGQEDEVALSSYAATQPVRPGNSRREGAGGRAINDTAVKVRGATITRKD